MITIRKSGERGQSRYSWLEARHSFSFGQYYDQKHMGFGPLRVINQDIVKGGAGFPMHAHDNMEIVTYILSGALEHKDSMGNTGVIKAGDLQRMSAGTGVKHSEYNHSATEECHLLQIWFLPEHQGIEPGYQQQSFNNQNKKNRLNLMVSREGRGGSLRINQDIDIYSALLEAQDQVAHIFADKRLGWIQVARGSLEVNGVALEAGDGAAISGEKEIVLSSARDAEILLFDMVP